MNNKPDEQLLGAYIGAAHKKERYSFFVFLLLFILSISYCLYSRSLDVTTISFIFTSICLLIGMTFEYLNRNNGIFMYQNGIFIFDGDFKKELLYEEIDFFTLYRKQQDSVPLSASARINAERQYLKFVLKDEQARPRRIETHFPDNKKTREALSSYIYFIE